MPFCAYCGREISAQAPSCPQCGHPGPAARITITNRPNESFAIASLACAIAGFVVIPVIGHILGIVFGHMSRGNLKKNPQLEGETLARAGIIIGWVGLAVSILVIALIVALVLAVDSNRVIIGPDRGRMGV